MPVNPDPQFPALSDAVLAQLLDAHAAFGPVPECPSLSAWMAPHELPLWEAIEKHVGHPVAPPMFALSWPASRVLAAAVMDGTIVVEGRVVDVGCGNGLLAVAAARQGARVLALDVDPLALGATRILAARHGVAVEVSEMDVLSEPTLVGEAGTIFCADVFYNQDTSARGQAAVRFWKAQQKRVFVADGGRPFFPQLGLPLLMERVVDVPASVEGASARRVRVHGP